MPQNAGSGQWGGWLKWPIFLFNILRQLVLPMSQLRDFLTRKKGSMHSRTSTLRFPSVTSPDVCLRRHRLWEKMEASTGVCLELLWIVRPNFALIFFLLNTSSLDGIGSKVTKHFTGAFQWFSVWFLSVYLPFYLTFYSLSKVQSTLMLTSH